MGNTRLYVLPICYIKCHLCGPCHIHSNMQLCKWTRYLAFVRLHQSKQMLPSVPRLLCPCLRPPGFFAQWNPFFTPILSAANGWEWESAETVWFSFQLRMAAGRAEQPAFPAFPWGTAGFAVSWGSWINVRKRLGLGCFSPAKLNRCDE